MAKESTSFDLMCVDDFFFSALFEENEDHDQVFRTSDDKFAEELQFQEVIMSSLIISQNSNTVSSLSITQECIPMLIEQSKEAAKQVGQSSQGFCAICVEKKDSQEMFKIETCSHSFCNNCISKHVATRIQDNIKTVMCPGLDCKVVLEFDYCRSVIPKDVLDRWDEVLCESLILASQKFYCPFRDCSAMLINDSEEVIRESECPICRRLFCARCYVPWHPGIECEEFQQLNVDERGREDLMVRELAKERNWKRCPNCKFFVEKTQGCLHITCRCGFEFCYSCGATWSSTHGGCQ